MEIKPGDLVMVVRGMPCCGYDGSVGNVLIVSDLKPKPTGYCGSCGFTFPQDSNWVVLSNKNACNKKRLKKIDPPSEGDSLPTRADLKLEA